MTEKTDKLVAEITSMLSGVGIDAVDCSIFYGNVSIGPVTPDDLYRAQMVEEIMSFKIPSGLLDERSERASWTAMSLLEALKRQKAEAKDEKLWKIAESLANGVHKSQLDRGGLPYIDHCYRVAARLKRRGVGTKGQILGLLHDTLEDVALTDKKTLEQNIVKYFGYDMLTRLQTLTRVRAGSYMDYIRSVSTDQFCIVVKVCDLEDNLDFTQERPAFKNQGSLRKRYAEALQFLLELP